MAASGAFDRGPLPCGPARVSTFGTMKDVIIYTTNYCPYCRQAEQFLSTKGVAFKNVDVTNDDAMREQLVELSGGRRTVPQIFIGGQPIGGYSDMMTLHQKGELLPMLSREGQLTDVKLR
jgi:glutaredoxin 3